MFLFIFTAVIKGNPTAINSTAPSNETEPIVLPKDHYQECTFNWIKEEAEPILSLYSITKLTPRIESRKRHQKKIQDLLAELNNLKDDQRIGEKLKSSIDETIIKLQKFLKDLQIIQDESSDIYFSTSEPDTLADENEVATTMGNPIRHPKKEEERSAPKCLSSEEIIIQKPFQRLNISDSKQYEDKILEATKKAYSLFGEINASIQSKQALHSFTERVKDGLSDCRKLVNETNNPKWKKALQDLIIDYGTYDQKLLERRHQMLLNESSRMSFLPSHSSANGVPNRPMNSYQLAVNDVMRTVQADAYHKLKQNRRQLERRNLIDDSMLHGSERLQEAEQSQHGEVNRRPKKNE